MSLHYAQGGFYFIAPGAAFISLLRIAQKQYATPSTQVHCDRRDERVGCSRVMNTLPRHGGKVVKHSSCMLCMQTSPCRM